jgi:hypothetical protein
MGLLKQQQLPSGFTVNYWSVQNAQINFSAKEASFTLLGYKDETTFQNGGGSATSRDVRMRETEFDQYFARGSADNICTQCYKAATAKEPLFKDAERV